ncbi:MAG: NADH-quinone oxidoreductase subunit N [Candidatus Goldbacteria bacterium]|nr:NADH-quinone oxidoreductase subunit N [Candidatus Goldiibacteriota bacterium]
MNISLLSHEFALAGVAFLIFILDLFGAGKKTTGRVFTFSMLAMLVYVILSRKDGVMLNGAYAADGISWFAKIVFLSGAFLTGMLSVDTLKLSDKRAGAYYFLLASSTLGMMFLASSKELITLYVSLELATISLYALAAIYREEALSLEAGIKYLILGAVSSGILLYGLSLIYGMTGTTYLDRILFYTSANGFQPVFVLAVIMVILGIGFKLSMVPMHVWTPDVYQGSPTPVTAFISVASKAAGFIFAIRLLSYTLIKAGFVWEPILAILALLTMTIGNLIAIPQKNIKRLLAYSTISQAGFLLVGFIGAPVIGVSSVLFYLLAYTVTNIAAFGVVAVFEKSTGSNEIDDYAGLAQTQPVMALTLMVALLSLAGIPPLVGFAGKVYLFYAAMEKGYLWLVIAGALNSTISLYYYLLILKRMYIWDKSKTSTLPKVHVPAMVTAALIICCTAMLVLGIMPGFVIDITNAAAEGMFRP